MLLLLIMQCPASTLEPNEQYLFGFQWKNENQEHFYAAFTLEQIELYSFLKENHYQKLESLIGIHYSQI